MSAKKATTKKKATEKKAVAKKTMVKKAAVRKATVKKAAAKKTTAKMGSIQQSIAKARRGDLIVIDSAQVGSPPREGEVLSIIKGDISVSYRVKWADGHETLISPAAGSVTILRA
jgi:hypothetical protein